jgi:2'-5' RNA ligase
MLSQVPVTIPAEIRDFPEWHRGRKTYTVWILPLENEAIRDKFEAAREHLNGYLLEPYQRQPHITLFVCGFLVDAPRYEDDFTQAQLGSQIQALENTRMRPFEIEIGGLNSFASAPFLEVHDPQGGIASLRETLANGAREFRTAPYRPHLTVGLYAGAFASEEVVRRLAEFPVQPIHWKVERIVCATYRAQEIVGRLAYRHKVNFIGDKQGF